MARMYVERLKNDLIRQFFRAAKLKFLENIVLTKDTIDYFLWMIKHPILENYPLSDSYLVVLFKYLFEKIVIDENEVSSTHIEYLYWRYAKLMLPPPLESIFYKHYILDDSKDLKPGLTVDSVITIQENSSIVSEGTTGLVTWEVINILSSRRLEQALDAGVALAIWCLRNQDKLEGKFIVELGSGTGLSGISACVNSKPRKYWFTDCHLGVLDIIKDNIGTNSIVHLYNCPYEVIKLAWENVENCERFIEEKPDLVLAADVIYDPTMFESLCKALKYFLTNNTTEIILFSTIRNTDTHQTFLETLGKYNLDFTEDILPDNYSMLMQQDCPIHIINVKQQTLNIE